MPFAVCDANLYYAETLPLPVVRRATEMVHPTQLEHDAIVEQSEANHQHEKTDLKEWNTFKINFL